ncbi:FemAB family peptidoglycan biosynthesis protein [Sporosarcina newyorkensis 2681]|uniref:Lipid II:glycine glycyltransferase n=1 Tax=Sporosarcina newyorkensis 2681 TaxID=1027292 RepID=F9DNM4_9BACL|nr:GNAT family N-acetyltransferase [Sporosarcina newyorkensis]EGQ27596.1 FemAB family peptidoglycan biosynthesis protein [Sporosarcina newyorkensis 2681]
MKLEVFETRDEWNGVLEKLSLIDVYYTYEYCSSSAELQNGSAKLIYFENELGIVVYPIIKREIDSALCLNVFDIITPYGYGGPLFFGDQAILNDFRKVFFLYCKNEGIVSEVITFHPLIDNALAMEDYCNLQFVRKTTAVDLTDDLETIRSQYSGMNKRNIKKAQQYGLTYKSVEKSPENINTFFNLYNGTMNRLKSTSFYYFPLNVIKQQLMDTPISKSHLLFVYNGDQVIAAAILFTGTHFAHYHLSGSDEQYLSMKPNNLIFDFMIELSKTEGCRLLHLGGGYEEDDGLFRYKTSFSNHNIFDYYIGKNILNPKVYKLLLDEKEQLITSNGSHFPQYRSVF